MTRTITTTRSGLARCRGFTLVELTVVLAILLVLVAIAAAVGRSVISGGRSQATADTIRLLDNVVFEYGQITRGSIPGEIEVVAEGQTSGTVWPIADAADLAGTFVVNPGDVIPSTALMLYVAQQNASPAYDLIAGIDPSLTSTASLLGGGQSTRAPVILDAFGNPIRFVHPQWDGRYGPFFNGTALSTPANNGPRDFNGVALRRSFLGEVPGDGRVRRGDADEGICQGDRPYFYSAGADSDPGTITDNVYGDDGAPKFPFETTEALDWADSGRDLSQS